MTRLRKFGYLVVSFLVSRRTLVDALDRRTRERDQLQAHARQLVADRNDALRQLVFVSNERDALLTRLAVARQVASDRLEEIAGEDR